MPSIVTAANLCEWFKNRHAEVPHLVDEMLKSAGQYGEIILCFEDQYDLPEANDALKNAWTIVDMVARLTNKRVTTCDDSEVLFSKQHGRLINFRRNKIIVHLEST